MRLSTFLSMYFRGELLDHMRYAYYQRYRHCQPFPKWLHGLTRTPAVHRVPAVPHPTPMLSGFLGLAILEAVK